MVVGRLCPSGHKLPERLPLYGVSSSPTGDVLLGHLIFEPEGETPLRFRPVEATSGGNG